MLYLHEETPGVEDLEGMHMYNLTDFRPDDDSIKKLCILEFAKIPPSI